MKKRTFGVASAAVLLIVTGGLSASRLIGFHVGGSFSSNGGHVWTYTNSFQGMVTVYDAHGYQIGQFGSGAGDPVNGQVDLTHDGLHYVLRGPGRHDIKDADGKLIAYALFAPPSASEIAQVNNEKKNPMPRDFVAAANWEWKHFAAGNASSGIEAGPVYVAGFDKQVKVFWMMRGRGSVRMTLADGKTNIGEGSTAPVTVATQSLIPPQFQFTDEELKIPQFIVSVDDKSIREQGYGIHVIRDTKGKTLLVLTADPPSPSSRTQ